MKRLLKKLIDMFPSQSKRKKKFYKEMVLDCWSYDSSFDTLFCNLVRRQYELGR